MNYPNTSHGNAAWIRDHISPRERREIEAQVEESIAAVFRDAHPDEWRRARGQVLAKARYSAHYKETS
jgi:hypothetical protein